jgi:tetratricopeptide (TPR) repeat protein
MRQIIILLLFLSSCLGQDNNQSDIDNLFDKATKADSICDFKTSISFYNQILAVDTAHAGALVNRGRALISIGDTTKGFSDLNKAVLYHPHEQTYYNRGITLLYINKDLKKAEQDLLTAIVFNKEFAESYYAMSMLKLNQGRLTESELYLEEADKRGFNKALSSQIKISIDRQKQ